MSSVYGAWLVQEALSLLNEKEANEITKDDINHRMKVSYNDKINFHCFKKTFLYDSDCWYNFPDCVEGRKCGFCAQDYQRQPGFIPSSAKEAG